MPSTRRAFLLQTGFTAASYARIPRANDRIRIAAVGVGQRGDGLLKAILGVCGRHNAEVVAVCDLWRVYRERAGVTAAGARQYGHIEQVLADSGVDAVVIATPDFQHAAQLKLAVGAGKDVYCEKPLANSMTEAKAVRDAVRGSKSVVQIGTQHRSEAHQIAVRDFLRTGALGKISKIEVVWNFNGPRWKGRQEIAHMRESDTDWRAFLMHKPARPFDAQRYFEWRLYREFCTGIPGQWMSHAADLVHFFTGERAPRSVVAQGGVFSWRDGRENEDTFQAVFEYRDFLFSYSTSFGNDSPSFTRIMGSRATLENIGGEGSPRWKWIEEKGNYEEDPELRRAERFILPPGQTGKPPASISWTDSTHLENWLSCVRSRKTPNASIEDGFAHSIDVVMSTRALLEGKRLYWDVAGEEITDRRA